MGTRAMQGLSGMLLAATLIVAGCAGDPATGPAYEVNADVFMLRFNNNPNPNGIPDYRYSVLATIADQNHVIASASLTGMGNTSTFAFNSATGSWWDDPASRYSTQAQPVFPMNYTIYIKYTNGRTATVPRTVTSWSAAP